MPYVIKKYSRNKFGFYLSRGEVIIKADTKENAQFFAKVCKIADPFSRYEVVKIQK